MKIPTLFSFAETANSHIDMELRVAKRILKKHKVSDFKTYYKATIIKTVVRTSIKLDIWINRIKLRIQK